MACVDGDVGVNGWFEMEYVVNPALNLILDGHTSRMPK